MNATAASIAADIGVQNVRVRAVGEDQGGFHPVNEADLFGLEYWSLEQAKFGNKKLPVMTGKVVIIISAAGAIGCGHSRVVCHSRRTTGACGLTGTEIVTLPTLSQKMP